MLPATAAFTLDAGRAAACPACGSAWVPCGQTNTAGCTACGQTAGTFCPVCGQTIAGCASCNAYGACHRGSRAGLAILYAPGVSLPGVTAMSRSCPWRGGQTEDPYRPVPQATILRP